MQHITINNEILDFITCTKVLMPYIYSCDVKWQETSSKQNQPIISPFILFDANFFLNKSKCHLILKPIKSITNKHAIEISKMFGCVMVDKVKRHKDYILMVDDSYEIQISHMGYICVRKNKQLYNMMVLGAYQFLIENGYDLPHRLLGGKTLQEAGLAIYK